MLTPRLGWSAPICLDLFTPVEMTWSSQLRFSQNFIGREWGNHKLRKLLQAYLESEDTQRVTEAEYVLQLSRKKPLPVIRDIDGRLRLIDNHHKFYAYVEFVGIERSRFRLYVKVVKDYQRELPAEGHQWQEQEMVDDLRQNSHILIYNNMSPTVDDLRGLPQSILDMPDMRARSIIGFVLNAMDLPLKGSDFTKMIQFKLYNRMVESGIDVEGKKPYSTQNIHRLRDLILSSPELLGFLHDRINPELTGSRKSKVVEFFAQVMGSR
jgi:hypothetical protein